MYIGKLRKAGIVVVSSNCFQRRIAEILKIRIINNDTRGNNFILWLRAKFTGSIRVIGFSP